MNDKWISHYREQGMSENQVASTFLGRSEYVVLSVDEKTELNKWIEECEDGNNKGSS